MLLSLLLRHGYAQVQQSPIVVTKKVGTTFTLDGVKLSPSQLEDVVRENPEALQEMKVARRNMIPVTVLSYAGGFMVGYPLGSAIGGGTPNWTMAGVGAGLLALSIPFSVGYSKHAQQAAELYNEGLYTSQDRQGRLRFRLGFATSGPGLAVTF
ncbi:hypothetical protein [Botryobacter ruber]|uniref:hypothetical protein n=1 Tax=Botryobacter ruber TaxID=2171629 RepID=UPI000FEC5F0F|nr:hypothetical protein [Botryobacter ruber]